MASKLFRVQHLRALLAFLPALSLVSGCGEQTPQDGEHAAAERVLERLASADGTPLTLTWDDLMPAHWRPEPILAEFDAGQLADEDPRAQRLMAQLKARWAEAPVVSALDGHRVRLAGLVIPLADGSRPDAFLLVPHFGACIHVPPPPANQTILVTPAAQQPYQAGLFDTVWVEGRLRVASFSHALGTAGYRIEGATVNLYQEL